MQLITRVILDRFISLVPMIIGASYLTMSSCPLYADIIKHVLSYLLAMLTSAPPSSTKNATMSNFPSKHAARKGVEFEVVVWFTSAPARTRRLTV